ncbi:hypothetical protein GAY31_19215 [Azospirillum brasilense]|nr:hypothetical protein [Azospirillum brasilense]
MTAKTVKAETKPTPNVEAQAAPPAADGQIAKANVVPLPQPKPAPMFEVALADLVLPEARTAKIRLPERVRLEADPAQFPKRRGHQVDPSRPASHIGVMPNLDLLEATGNPYPASGDHDTVVTDDKWKPYVALAHHIWRELVERGEVKGRDPEVVKEALKQAGLTESATYAAEAMSDTLRDLALVGLADQFLIGRSRLFRRPSA